MKERSSSDFDLEILSSHILRFGVGFSCLLIAVAILALLSGDRSSSFPQTLQQLLATNYSRPTLDFSTLLHGLA
ncbi:MAG: hypothetical protein ACHQ1H_14265, partial [Nitrososphaerales archaeon]